jgi:hypothetical protein
MPNPGELSDTGFFKLFVFSEYIEVDWFVQEYVFEGFSRHKSRWVLTGVPAWGATVTVPRPQSSNIVNCRS